MSNRINTNTTYLIFKKNYKTTEFDLKKTYDAHDSAKHSAHDSHTGWHERRRQPIDRIWSDEFGDANNTLTLC